MARLRHLAPEMEPEFGLCFPGRQKDELAATGVPVHDLGPVRFSRPWTIRRARRRLRRILAVSKPEVVVIHSSWSHAALAPEVRRAGIKLVFIMHNPATGREWLERWAARTPPDLVVSNSRFTAGSARVLFPDARVEQWYYPVSAPAVDPSVRSDVRLELGASPGAVVILQASRLEEWKGQAVLLEALGLLGDVPGWECWLAGGAQKGKEDQYLAELRAVAERCGVADRIRFLGQRADVPRLMAAADVFCQPNTGPEPFGIVFVEALYAGLPVVTSRFGGAIEIVDETCGVLTTPGDSTSVAAALAGLVRDPARRQVLAACGPGRAGSLCGPAGQLAAAAVMFARPLSGS